MNASRRSVVSSIEILEPRVAPAAVIDIVTKGGSAFIKVLGNTDTIEDLTIAGALDGTLFISGANGETFRVNGVAGNGPIQLPKITGNLSVDLGKNQDSLTVTGVFLGGALNIKMGDGQNTTTITSSTVGSFKYTGGKNQDIVSATGSVFTVAGKATFTGGAGTNGFSLTADAVRIGGDLLYVGGADADTLAFSNNNNGVQAIIGGSATMKGANGATTLVSTYDTFVVGKNLTFTGGFNPTQDASNLVLNASELIRIGGSLSYSHPSGKQQITVVSGTVLEISGALTLKAKPSEDTTAGIGGGNYFSAGKITVLGSGEHLSLTISSQISAIGGAVTAKGLEAFTLASGGLISGPVTVGVGVGGLTLGAINLANPLDIAGKVAIKVTTPNNVSTKIAGVRFHAGFTANLAAGLDSVTIDNITTFGRFVLNTGAGSDVISIETDSLAGGASFYGAVSINLGAGVDTLFVGDGNANDRIYAYQSFRVSGAGQPDVVSLLNGNTFVVNPVVG